ncbi:MAG: hypothetical protein P1R58_06835 [bacterium]|nr:hypothetical protein [bacterium]
MRTKVNAAAILCLALLFAISALADSSLPPPANIRITQYPELNNEMQSVICPTDSNVIIANWRDFRLGYRRVGIGRSTDGGQTWIDSLIPASMMLYGFDSKQSDPTMTVDAAGNYYMSILDYDAFGLTGGTSLPFYKSTDKGVSWTGPFPIIVPVPTDGIFEDKQFITADRTGGPHDGNLYCSWTRFYNGPNRMLFVRSTDGGSTFHDSVVVGPQQTSSACGATVYDAGQFSIPIVGADGSVHVFWVGTRLDSASCSFYRSIKHVVSNDGGVSFTYEDNILDVSGYSTANGGINTYSQPVGEVDLTGGPFAGNMYIAFTNAGDEDTNGNSDVDFIVSRDNAVTWTDRIQANDAEGSDAIDSFHPWLVVNDEGVVIMVYYDQRLNGPTYNNFDLYAAYSFDGGETITSNRRISTVSSSPFDLASAAQDTPIPWIEQEDGTRSPTRMAPRAGLIGEYIGLSAYHDKVNSVWTDSRDGNSECYTANWYLSVMVPRLASPLAGDYISGTGTFEWATSWKHDDDRYRIEISSDPAFSSLEYSATIDTNFHINTTSLADGLYYWRVKTFAISTSDSSEYSEIRLFEVDTSAPAAPALIYPEPDDFLLNPLPVFEWSGVTKSAPITYDLYLSSDIGFPVGPLTTVYSDLPFPQYALTTPLVDSVDMYWKVVAHDAAGNSTESATQTFIYRDLQCGDLDGSGSIDIADLTFFVDYLFAGGPPPLTIELADFNGDGSIDIADLTYFVDYLFAGGPPPVC